MSDALVPLGSCSWRPGDRCGSSLSSRSAPAPNGRKSVALHWSGDKWTRVTTKNPGGLQTFLAGVDGVSNTDVWAVGRSTGASAFKTLAERYSCK